LQRATHQPFLAPIGTSTPPTSPCLSDIPTGLPYRTRSGEMLMGRPLQERETKEHNVTADWPEQFPVANLVEIIAAKCPSHANFLTRCWSRSTAWLGLRPRKRSRPQKTPWHQVWDPASPVSSSPETCRLVALQRTSEMGQKGASQGRSGLPCRTSVHCCLTGDRQL